MKAINIAIAIIQNNNGEVLVAQRPKNKDFSGYWEFPGGKIESGETAEQAIIREVYEELGIQARPSRKLISFSHLYPNKRLQFEVWLCAHMMGKIEAKEGQGFVRWVSQSEIEPDKFPPANKTMINALTLPEQFLITESVNSAQAIIKQLKQAFNRGGTLIQVRQKQPVDEFSSVFNWLTDNKPHNARVFLNSDSLDYVDGILDIIDGVHLTSKALFENNIDALNVKYAGLMFSGSCHNAEEIDQASQLGLDFITLSPVLIDKGNEQLGWYGFFELLDLAPMPAYALGGVTEKALLRVLSRGAQGIAGISFWQ